MSSKMLDATCDAAGKVTADGSIILEAQVLSEGKKASSGVAFIEADKCRYITSSATDIKDLITSLVSIIEQVVTILTALDSISAVPGGQTANIAQLTALKTTLNSSKETLK